MGDIKETMQKIVSGAGILMMATFAGKVMVDENNRRQKAFTKTTEVSEKSLQTCDQSKGIIFTKNTDKLSRQPLVPMAEIPAAGKADRLKSLPMQQATSKRVTSKTKKTMTGYNTGTESNLPKNDSPNNPQINCPSVPIAQPQKQTQQTMPNQNKLPRNKDSVPSLQTGNICATPFSARSQQPQKESTLGNDAVMPPTQDRELANEPEANNDPQPDISASPSPKKLWVNNAAKPEDTIVDPSDEGGRNRCK